jgi:hypothetical protein
LDESRLTRKKWKKEPAMKKMLTIIASVVLLLGFSYGASAWIFVPDQGDTGWRTYVYTAGPEGFTGSACFVVSNVKDDFCYSELLLDNLSQGGGENGLNRGFEQVNLTGYNVWPDSSFADVYTWRSSALGTVYNPTEGIFLASLLGLSNGVDTSGFYNAIGEAGTVGAILETAIALAPGEQFSFDWAFLGNDSTPWNDFARFYLKDPDGNAIVFSDGLAQIGPDPVPVPPTLLLFGSGLLGLLGLFGRGKSRD